MKTNRYAIGGVAVILVALAAATAVGDSAGPLRVSAATAERSGAGPVPVRLPPGAGQLQVAGRTGGPAPLPDRFAALPDAGDLVAYPKTRVARRDGPYTWHRANVSEAHALRAIEDGVLTVTAPSGERLEFQYDRHVRHPSGDWTWIGHALGGSQAEDAILTFGAGAVFGTMSQAGGAALKLAMQDGASWLVETDLAALSAKNRAEGRHATPDFLLPPDMPVIDSIQSQAAGVRGSQAAATTTTVDVVVGYTAGFETANKVLNNLGPVMTRLNFLVDVTNESYVNSNVAMKVRMVHAMKVAYPDTNDNSDALRALTGSDGTSTPTFSAVDALLQPLHQARDQYGADLVSLVRDFQHPEAVSCGVAWLLGGGQQTVHSGYGVYGMSVVSDGADGGYFCEETTFAHELGHNMGLAHDVETAKGDDGVLDGDEYGRFAYSFGYRTGPTQGSFYTVMAYSDTQETSYRVFSNPDITSCGGFACGIPNQADNARTLRQTGPIIATFRATVVPEQPDPEPEPEVHVERDWNGDGRADLIWFNPAAGMVQAWEMDGAAWAYGPVHQLGSNQYRVAGIGDFNGDGQADVLWRDVGSTELWAWLGKPDGTVEVVYLRGYPAGWQVAGVDDFNADGRADVLWYSPGQGLTQVWYMNGSSWAYGPVNGLPANAYAVSAIGDFSGDGRADIVWHDLAKTTLWMWSGQADGSFTVTFLRDYPTGWSIEGTGDANDDGRKDIFWHNQAAGLQQTWLMNGTTWTYGQPFGIASQYQVGAIDDFNGDGRVDIMWHDGVDAWVWLAGTSSYTVHYLRGYPAGWVVANTP